MTVELVEQAWMDWGRWIAAGLVWALFLALVVDTAMAAGKRGKHG